MVFPSPHMMEGSFLTCHVQYVMWLGERSVSQTNSLPCCIILREIRRCHRGELSPLSKRNWGEGFLSLLPLDAFVEPLPKIFFEGRIFIAVERERVKHFYDLLLSDFPQNIARIKDSSFLERYINSRRVLFTRFP